MPILGNSLAGGFGGGGMTIGDAVVGGTDNAVLYIGPTGLLANNAGFLWGPTAGQGLTITAGTATTDVAALGMTQTWNNAGVTFNGLTFDVTSTASAAASRIVRLRVGGATMLSVDKAGNVVATGYVNAVAGFYIGAGPGSGGTLLGSASNTELQSGAGTADITYRGGTVGGVTAFHRFQSLINANITTSSGISTNTAVEVKVNQTGTAGYTGHAVLVTETGVGSGLKLLYDGQVGAVRMYAVDNSGRPILSTTTTAGGTTGAQTINKPTGTVNFAAAATTLVVTNSLVSATSLVWAFVQSGDATALSARAVPAAGSFTITLNGAAAAETKVGFVVFNL